METKYYINPDGTYAGAFVNGAKPPKGCLEVPTCPEDGRMMFNGSAWVMPETEVLSSLRAKRDAMLKSSDWTQLPDAPVDRVAWAEYRQALRDLTSQPDVANVNWPEKPEVKQ